jgi:hypothetical protein
MRRRLAWLVTVPLLLASSQFAHALAYRWVYPEVHLRVQVLLASGHGYMSRLPLALGAAGAIALLALAAAAGDAARGRPVRDLPAWAFALLPPVAFVLQEFLELSLHLGRPAWHVAAARTFVPGLVLQLPFALAAYVVAGLLLRTAERIGRAFAAVPRPRLSLPAATPPSAAPGGNAPRSSRTTRGPPLPSTA